MTDQQAVEEKADAQVTPDAEVSNDAPDLESLLKEWETDEQPAAETKKEATSEKLSPQEIAEIAKYVKEEREAKLSEATSKAYQETIKSIKGDLAVPEKIVDGYLRVKAAEDPRVLKAYQNRAKSPEAWSKVEKAIQKELRDAIGALPDKGSTDTRKAVAAAISNAQSSTPETIKSLGSLSNSEFEALKEKALKSAG